MNEGSWRRLLDKLREGNVVPVVGSQLYVAPDGTSLQARVARRFFDILRLRYLLQWAQIRRSPARMAWFIAVQVILVGVGVVSAVVGFSALVVAVQMGRAESMVTMGTSCCPNGKGCLTVKRESRKRSRAARIVSTTTRTMKSRRFMPA